jgi:hypothetical protein
MKILKEAKNFDRKSDKSERIIRQVWKTLLEPGEKGQTCPVFKTRQSNLQTGYSGFDRTDN